MSVPLSFSQERVWFLDHSEPRRSAYSIPFALRMTGDLSVAALEQSISEILRRHEVLRTTFHVEDGHSVQRIAPSPVFTLEHVDLSGMSERQRETEAQELARKESSYIFNLTTGPLLKATLLRLKPDEHLLFLTAHQIVFDEWSKGILYSELCALYGAFSKGEPSLLDELTVQYADFAVWQRTCVQGGMFEGQLAFWKEHLGGLSALDLPTDRPGFSAQTFRSAVHSVHFSQGLTQALLTLSREEGATLFMTLLAAFQCLLYRYTGQDDIVVGTLISNRDREEIDGLIGPFVNTLVIRTDTSGDPAFRDLLKRVRQTALDANTHRDLPFEKLVKELQPEHDLSRNPLFQVMFTFQNMPLPSLQLAGLTLSWMEIQGGETGFHLELRVEETEGILRCAFLYNTDLFDAATIERMAGHYQRILEGIVVNPEQRLSELPLLTEAELHRILNQWNDTAKDYSKDKCIHDLFEEQVERTPDALAVIFEDRQLTYRELNSKANQLAHYLRKNGVGPEVLVGICTERSPEMIMGVLGILKAGGAYVPLDPAYPKERLGFMIEDTQAPAILTQRHLVNVLPELAVNVICLDSDLKTITKEGKENPVSGATDTNLACVFYTSGSTGIPKGVCIPHRGVTQLVLEPNYIKFDSSDRIGQASSFSFDAATFEIWGALLNGACLVGIPKELTLSPEDFATMIRKQRISVLFLTTALFNQMAHHVPAAFRSLRYLLFGGEAVDPVCVRMVAKAGKPHRLLHVYGPTESTTFTSWYPVDDVPAEDVRTIPIGKPVSNTSIFLLDGRLNPVPIGVSGELYIGGDRLARGYLNRPELNAERFIPNPFSNEPGALLYKTGDLARYLPDGNIEFIRRIDQQVKIRGFRIELGEIEATIAQHPSVKGTVVIVREDRPGDKRLVAYVVLTGKPAMMAEELRRFLKERLPDYMVPSAFVVMEALPLTPNGKIDRRALPVPDRFVSGPEKSFTAPRNTVESQLIRIWEKVLGLQPIGITDNFFDLGGHSLLALRLISEVKKVTGKNLPVSALYQAPTIEQLGKMLTGKDRSVQWSSLAPIQTVGSKKPFYWTHGQESNAHLSRYLDDDQPFYALHHQGADGKRVRHTTVEEIAAHYLREVRTVQSYGPYLLGGYSFGGTVAFEMAQQLYRQGEEVSLLFLLNPPEKCFPHVDLRPTSSPKKETFRSRLVYHKENVALLPARDRMAYILRKLPSVFHWIKARTWSPLKIIIKKIICKFFHLTGYPLPVSLRTFYLLDIYYKAITSYTPQCYPGKVVLCHSDKALYGSRSEISRSAAGGMDFYTVKDAEHLELITEPYVGIWARYLKMCLDEAHEKRR